jgi:hypothetical protein
VRECTSRHASPGHQGLHTEARPLGIKVTAVVAGGMRTPFLFERFPDLDPGVLQDPAGVARTILFVLTQLDGTVIPEVTVLPMRETSWPCWLRTCPTTTRAMLHRAGFRLVVVTNQSGVARGMFAEDALGHVEHHLRRALRAQESEVIIARIASIITSLRS